jgi:hypothetical protein
MLSQSALPSSLAAAAVDVAMGAAVATDNNDVVGAVVPPSLTVGASVAFEGTCVGAFPDGAGPLGNNDNVKSMAGKGSGGDSLAPWGTETVAAPVDSIIAIVVIVLVVSRDLAAKGGVGVVVPPLVLTLPMSSAVAALFLPLNVCRSTSHRPALTLHGNRPVYHHHCPPVRAFPTTFCCRLPPLLIVNCPPPMAPTIVVP